MVDIVAMRVHGAMLGALFVAACTGQVVTDPPSAHGGSRSSTLAAGVTVGTTGSGTVIGAGGMADGTGGTMGGAGGRGGAGGSSSDLEQLCVDTINTYRATLGLAPYTRWNAEETCADGQAQSDSMTGMAHGAFGQCTEMAQNECPGWAMPANTAITGCLQSMWNEGPGTDFNAHGHYINMSSAKYKQVACGFYTTSAGKIWSVQDFK